MTTLAALTGYYLRASFKSKFAVVFGAVQPLFAGSSTSSTVLWGVLVTVVFTGVGSTIGTKVFQRENT